MLHVRPEEARTLLLAVMLDDVATVRSVLHSPAVQDYYSTGCHVNPVHVGVLRLHTASVAALLEHSALFHPDMVGSIDKFTKRDGLGDVRRLLPANAATPQSVLDHLRYFHVRVALVCAAVLVMSSKG